MWYAATPTCMKGDINCNVFILGDILSNPEMVMEKKEKHLSINKVTSKTLHSYDKMCSMEINIPKIGLRSMCVIFKRQVYW